MDFFWDKIGRIVAELKKADAFDGSFYGWATSAAGHWAIIGMAFGFSLAPFMPPLWVFAVSMLLYGIAWEGIVQGWSKGQDAFIDTAFVGLGAVAAAWGSETPELFHLWALFILANVAGVYIRA